MKDQKIAAVVVAVLFGDRYLTPVLPCLNGGKLVKRGQVDLLSLSCYVYDSCVYMCVLLKIAKVNRIFVFFTVCCSLDLISFCDVVNESAFL